MNQRALFFLAVTNVLVCCGCVSLPELPYLVRGDEHAGEAQPAMSCEATAFASAVRSSRAVRVDSSDHFPLLVELGLEESVP